jgi:hypothetical protein
LRLFTLAQFINDWGYLAKVESQLSDFVTRSSDF